MSYLFNHLYNKARFRRLCALLLFIIIFGLISFTLVESITPFDAFRRVITLITSGSYGDLPPTTLTTQIISLIIQILGVSFFSILFVLIATVMTQSTEHFHHHRTHERLEEIEKKLDLIHKHLQAHQSLKT